MPVIFQFVFRKICFLLMVLYMYVKTISSTLVGMGFRSHDVEDEPKKAFQFHLLSHVQKLSFFI